MQLELVFIPSPGDGHIRPLVEVAKLLVDRDDRISVTILIIPQMLGFSTGSSNSYISSLSTASQDRLHYNILSVPEEPNSDAPKPNFLSFINSFKPQVKATVEKLTNLAKPESRLAGFVVDMFCTDMIDVANEFNVPSYLFYTSNATFLALQFHVQYLYDVEKYDVSELKDSDITELEVPCMSRPLPVKCFPSVLLNKDWLPVVFGQVRRFKETKGILVNSFAELEPQAMKFFSGQDNNNNLPTVYPVGPVLSLKTNGQDSKDDKQTEILSWLDEQPRGSVVFLCFGSMGGFREDQAKEIAIALERSGHRFLWSLRRARPKGTMGQPGDFTNLEEILPEGFLDRTAKIGKIIGWAPQNAILANPAVRGFMSHCGWNSTLESLWFGVPIATWPLYAEQQVNAFQLVEELGLAVEVRNSFRADIMAAESELMTAEEIERGVRCLMEKDDVRDRVKEMSEKSHVALMEGGSSHAALLKFIEDVTMNIS